MEEVATKNSQCKIGWPTTFTPFSRYKMSNGDVILGGDTVEVNSMLLLRQTIKNTLSGQTGGGKIRDLKLGACDLEGGFRELEGKVDKYFRGVELGDREFLLSLKSLDGKKIYIKKYRNKNL